jgi:hypothetical protein
LGAYKYNVFLNFREVKDNDWHQYSHLTSYLNGRGVPDIDEALKEIFLRPIHYPFKELVNVGLFNRLLHSRVTKPHGEPTKSVIDKVEQKAVTFLGQIKQFTGGTGDEKAHVQEIIRELNIVLRLSILEDMFPQREIEKLKKVLDYLKGEVSDNLYLWGSLFSWLFVHSLGKIVVPLSSEQQSRTWIDEWLLGRIITGSLRDFGLDESLTSKAVLTVKLLTSQQQWFKMDESSNKPAHRTLNSLLKDYDARQFLHINRHQDILWFNKEAFEELLWWMVTLAVLGTCSDPQLKTSDATKIIVRSYDIVMKLHQAGEDSGYQVEKLTEVLKD